MTVAIPVRDVTYSGDALRGRIDDLGLALEHGMAAVVSSGTWTHDGPDRIRAAERLRLLLGDIDRLRDALQSVWATIHAGEQSRADTAGASTQSLMRVVMSGPLALLYSAWSGHLWPALRPVADRVIEIMPRYPAGNDDVIVTAGPSAPITPPQSLRDRVDRIPGGDTHIRIERFPVDGGNRFEVYLSGTNFQGDGTDPWNVASNVDLATTGSSPSLVAVRTAMESAGITAATPVVITGHSQGGLIALALAGSREFAVDAVITIGTPVGVVPDVDGIPTVHIVHPEDPVPAIGGLIDTRSSTWLVPAAGGERLFEAHHRESYGPSASEIDELHDEGIDSLRDAIQSNGVGIGRDYRAVSISGQNRGTGAE